MYDQKAYGRKWRANRIKRGLCVRCPNPGRNGLCDHHRERARLEKRKYYKPRERFRVTLDMMIHDLKCVADRLKIRRLTSSRYQKEGSFSLSPLHRKLDVTWRELCHMAGLLPTARGCKGVDIGRCMRCPREVVKYGPEPVWCKDCRRLMRARKIGEPEPMPAIIPDEEREAV